MGETRTQYLFLDSSRRLPGSTSYSAEYSFVEDVCTCRPGEKMFVTLRAASVPHTWKQINSGVNDRFTVVEEASGNARDIVLAPGNYPFKALAAQLCLAIDNGVITFDVETALFTFRFPTSHRLIFSNTLAKVLGFSVSEQPSGIQFTSSRPVQTLASTHYLLRLDGLNPSGLNADNDGPEICPSMSLACIFDNSLPNGTLVFDEAYATYTMALQDTTLRYLRITWTEFMGQVATYIPDHQLVLQIDYKKADTSSVILKAIYDTVSMLLTYITLPA